MAMPKLIWLVLVWFLFTMESIIKQSWSLPSCPENERQALLSFKNGVDQLDESNRLSSWVVGHHDCCKWEGVGCNNETGHVVKLDLRNPSSVRISDDGGDVHLAHVYSSYEALDNYERAVLGVWKVSPSLLELKHLNYLDLSGNFFTGMKIPDFFGSFQELRYLNLSFAFFGGVVPHSLGNLSALRSLDLSTDGLGLSTDDLIGFGMDAFHWASKLSKLQTLDLSGLSLNHIQDDLSRTLTSFPSLLELRLSSCELGKVPLSHSHQENLTSLVILHLSSNDIGGPIPNVIRNMSSLIVLDLSKNHLVSDGPTLGNLRNLINLETLDLSYNQFEEKWTKSFGHLSSPSFGDKLQTLYLSSNRFHGSFPKRLFQLKNLKALALDNNRLNGSIPTSLDNLSTLEVLDLSGNAFSGSFPTSLVRLSNLESLHLSNNQLNGSLSTTLGQLSKLSSLVLEGNSFDGVVTEKHFATLSKLELLNLGSNSLSLNLRSGWVPPFQLKWIYLKHCNVGPRFPEWLQKQTNLRALEMPNANISDFVPTWFPNITSRLYSLNLSHNQIHGKLSDIIGSHSTLSYLFLLDLSNNSFGGPIPKSIGAILSNMVFLGISNNHLNGGIPNSFCEMEGLENFDLSRNNLSGSLPRCWSSVAIYGISLSFNQLSGTIPDSIGQLSTLSFLYLSNNNFHGELPITLRNCTSLYVLDVGENKLAGELPTWFGESMPLLKVLRLRSNKYNGTISRKLCRLNQLRILDLAHNHLSGTIPHCFNNFSAMVINKTHNLLDDFNLRPIFPDRLSEVIKGRELEYINNVGLLLNMDLSSNNFVGWIPKELTSLSALISLNLSNNRLIGKIPYNIGRMRSLESLDLSSNHLSGAIPPSISSLLSLSHFNVSYNHLSGTIPTGNQLQTLDDPSSMYISNPELCGHPLKKQCPRDESPVYVNSKREKDDEDEFKVWLYIGMASS